MTPILVTRQATSATKPYPIVFVHGAWHGAWCWEEHFLDYFAQQGYSGVAFDLRQHGAAVDSKVLRWCRIDDYVADLASVVETLASPVILMGHSMGGLVVQKYLEQAQAKAAVLLAPVPVRGALGAALRTARRIPGQFLKVNLQLRLYPLIEREILARDAFFSRDIDPALLSKHFARLRDESYTSFLDMVVFRLPKPERITTPVFVLGAQEDAIFTPEEIRHTARAYGGEALIFAQMAHDMMLERGWRDVAEAALQWLDQQAL